MATKLLTSREAAELLRLDENTLRHWRASKRQDLPWHKVGRAVRYRESDVAAFLDRCRAV